MSDLKPADIQELMKYIRKKTKKGPGYVWDFNDLTFSVIHFGKCLKNWLKNVSIIPISLLTLSLQSFGNLFLTKPIISMLCKFKSIPKDYSISISFLGISETFSEMKS